jgi:hypothetical protein
LWIFAFDITKAVASAMTAVWKSYILANFAINIGISLTVAFLPLPEAPGIPAIAYAASILRMGRYILAGA